MPLEKTTLRKKAELLRRLHHDPALLVLPNAWDVASAVALAAVPGVRALATTSAGVARSLGFEDGEQAPRDEMVRAASRIAAAIAVPVTADLEAGYGDPVGTARAAWDGGVVGMNFEDSPGGTLRPAEEQASLIRAIRTAVPELVVNARVDVFLRGAGGVDEAVERGNTYLAAGADCVYPIVCPADSIAELVDRIDGPVNVLLTPGGPQPDELERLGVARVTWGSGLAALAYAKAVRVATAAAARSGG
jgi:2-methylisocitrate lyase-like PEP mutase family enzyme